MSHIHLGKDIKPPSEGLEKSEEETIEGFLSNKENFAQ